MFTAEQVRTDPILRYFTYRHLAEPLREVSESFAKQASYLVEVLPRSAERTVALRKLLEAKDAAVRGALPAQRAIQSTQATP
jgi:hypothetical protein